MPYFISPAKPDDSDMDGAYRNLRKSAADLGKFIRLRKAHCREFGVLKHVALKALDIPSEIVRAEVAWKKIPSDKPEKHVWLEYEWPLGSGQRWASDSARKVLSVDEHRTLFSSLEGEERIDLFAEN